MSAVSKQDRLGPHASGERTFPYFRLVVWSSTSEVNNDAGFAESVVMVSKEGYFAERYRRACALDDPTSKSRRDASSDDSPLLRQKAYSSQIERLEYLSNLGNNWDGYNALPPSPLSIEISRQLITESLRYNFLPYYSVPDGNGGLIVELVYNGDRHFRIHTDFGRPILVYMSSASGVENDLVGQADSPETALQIIQRAL